MKEIIFALSTNADDIVVMPYNSTMPIPRIGERVFLTGKINSLVTKIVYDYDAGEIWVHF